MYYIAGVMKTRSVPPPESTPEHWRAESSDGVAVLNIPGLNGRARLFDVDVLLMVSVPAEPPSEPKGGGDSGANPAQEPKKPQR